MRHNLPESFSFIYKLEEDVFEEYFSLSFKKKYINQGAI